ncbi:MAG TPA: DUF1579 domain-containing protein [Acidobacteriota bacterium]|nr:DUF1579 domain-containing protein [Acidobacteriota bacterium]
MKTRVVFIIAAAALLVTLPLAAQSQADKDKAMEAYMKAGAVTANHEFFKSYVGAWDVETTMWTLPGKPPTKSKNTFDASLILGGRFIKMTFQGTMMGMPFEGLQIIGFDNIQGKYITLWIDNTSTSFFQTSGTRDGNTISETGEWLDPVTGVTSKVRALTKWIGPDEVVYETYMVLPDGKEFKNMENHCLRKKVPLSSSGA